MWRFYNSNGRIYYSKVHIKIGKRSGIIPNNLFHCLRRGLGTGTGRAGTGQQDEVSSSQCTCVWFVKGSHASLPNSHLTTPFSRDPFLGGNPTWERSALFIEETWNPVVIGI